MKEQIMVVGASHQQPPLPSSTHNNNAMNSNMNKMKKTDTSSSNGNNSVETTERSSTETNPSSPTNPKHTRHMNDAHADPRTFSTCVSSVPTGARQTPPRPNQNNGTTMIVHRNSNEPNNTNSTEAFDSNTKRINNNNGSWKSGAEPINLQASSSRLQNQQVNVLSQKQLKPPIMDSNRHNGKATQMGGNNNGAVKENKSEAGLVGANSRIPLNDKVLALVDPSEQEQALFEQRLCDEACGVAVRKINQYGKSNLRYVRCVTLEEGEAFTKKGTSNRSLSSHSASSWGRNPAAPNPLTTVQEQKVSENADFKGSAQPEQHQPHVQSLNTSLGGGRRVLTWGKRKDVQIPLDCFVCVRTGKTTDRAKKNSAAANRILSLIANSPNQLSLDIEAPTKMDRDKFAKAFARFLSIPLEGDDSAIVPSVDRALPLPMNRLNNSEHMRPPQPALVVSSQQSAPGEIYDRSNQRSSLVDAETFTNRLSASVTMGEMLGVPTKDNILPISENGDHNISFSNHNASSNVLDVSDRPVVQETRQAAAIITIPVNQKIKESGNKGDEDEASHISSLTGHGYDHELIEELHNALNELRAELEESRAEAARAVKVAEQAIQSAERSNSIEWQNTVTHKAAEAAARAQKQSAGAMAKARIAEERLEGEKRTAQFWRKQAEFAEEEAGTLQTRAAAAEVQRADMEEQLNIERRMFQDQLKAASSRFNESDVNQREALEAALERNRALEMELDATRRDLMTRSEYFDLDIDLTKANMKKKRVFGRKNKKNSVADELNDSKMLLSSDDLSSEARDIVSSRTVETLVPDKLVELHAETKSTRREFEKLRRATVDELYRLPLEAKVWGTQIRSIVNSSQSEILRLKDQLAMEKASRRKLLHEVQDLRGAVRVYCRPRSQGESQLISVPSHEVIVLDRTQFPSDIENITSPTSFEYDRVFPPGATQQDVYTEIEDVCLSCLDGYKICIMAYGQAKCGKTHTLLGNAQQTEQNDISIQDPGVFLRVTKQILSIAQHRRERYKDSFSLTILEVYDEKLYDLLASTEIGETRGVVLSTEAKNRSLKSDEDTSSSKPGKLEIRTDVHGETVVQGLLSVAIESYEEVVHLWEECLAKREQRILDQGYDRKQYQSSSHILATLQVTSSNIATGTGTIGKIQFVDLASVDIIHRQQGSSNSYSNGNNESSLSTISANQRGELRFTSRSLETLSDVVEAKCQFDRTVPYRNSTLTHLLQDSLEADTKVLMIACISMDPQDIQTTLSVLRFASRIRRLTVGKATKHSFSPSSS